VSSSSQALPDDEPLLAVTSIEKAARVRALARDAR
jgi:hypothetical protein